MDSDSENDPCQNLPDFLCIRQDPEDFCRQLGAKLLIQLDVLITNNIIQ